MRIAGRAVPLVPVFALVIVAALLAGCESVPVDETARLDAIVYQNGAVACDHPIASEAGLEMLRKGGNAVDAAVAASFCLSVVRPYSCGIGGGGFMLIAWPDGSSVAVNYRETAPAAVGPDYYVQRNEPLIERFGVHSVAVPGTVAGLLHVLETYGTLDRATVIAPAVRVARAGWPADANAVDAAEAIKNRLEEHPHLRGRFGSLWRGQCREGDLAVGDMLANPQQARALELIAAEGADGFYRGAIARAIVEVMDEAGGPLSGADLEGYELRETAPLAGHFRGCEILSMPLPSSGGIAMQQIFGLLDRLDGASGTDLAARGHNAPEYVHLVTESMKHAFADRAVWLADDAYVEVPTARLLSDAYLDDRAARIDPAATQPPGAYGSLVTMAEDGGTSHISVIDSTGIAVACTETINLRYGSLVEVPGFGFVLNNEMDDFTTIPGAANAFGLRQSDRNLPVGGKRPLSSMSPTIVRRDGDVVLVAGASGGPRIITGTAQSVLNCLVFDSLPAAAVAAPRFHHQWQPDTLQFETLWTDAATIDAMTTFGHDTGRRATVGKVQLIRIDDDGIRAASDPRKGGRPAGY